MMGVGDKKLRHPKIHFSNANSIYIQIFNSLTQFGRAVGVSETAKKNRN